MDTTYWVEVGQQAPWLLVSFALAFVVWRVTKWTGAKFTDMYEVLFDKKDGKLLKLIDHQAEFVESVKTNNIGVRQDIAITLESIKNIERKINQMSKIGFENMNSEYFGILFEYSELPTAFVDADFNFMSGNAKFSELLGYTNEELRKLTVMDVTAESDITADITQAEKVKSGEIDFYRLEKSFIRKDKSTIYCTLFCYRIPSEGPFNHFIGTVVPSTGI